jgi:transposase
MLDLNTRQVILRLHSEGHGMRTIAAALNVSRNAVKRVLKSGVATVPAIERSDKTALEVAEVKELHLACQGNLVRVHEELLAKGVTTTYSTLTRFCRNHEIGVKQKQRAGQYHFDVGVEMQHDTSPHDVEVGGKVIRLQCASLVLCYSRMLYAQVFTRFNRFQSKIFLTDAVQFFNGAAAQCMLDNSTVIMVGGTGKNANPAPEMQTFSERFGFEFIAHEKGDANRSARVERNFHYIENNFYVGRVFEDLDDLNRQFVAWCNKANGTYRKRLRASPLELYQLERPHLKPLPIHIPEVYALHHRVVDLEGRINLHTNRYSVPEKLIGKTVEVRESKLKVCISLGHQLICEHQRRPDGSRARATLAEHKYIPRIKTEYSHKPTADEKTLRHANKHLSDLIDKLQKEHRGHAARKIKKLYRMFLEYPTELLADTVQTALTYRLTDLERIEKMVLKNAAGEFFQLSIGVHNEEKNNQNGEEETSHQGDKKIEDEDEDETKAK